MDKCRICLSDKRKLQSIYDCNDGYTYASMMMSVAHIKIVKNEEITEGICKRCSQKLKEAYDLKVEIERSHEALQNAAGFKRIHFTNLQEKIHVMEIDTSKKMPEQCYNDLADSLKDGKSSLVFKNITIQKVEAEDNKIKKENEPLSVVDFLNSFKPEENESYQDYNDFHSYDEEHSLPENHEYDLPLTMRKIKAKKRNAKKKNKSSTFKHDDDTSYCDDADNFDHDQSDDDYTPKSDDDEDPDYNLIQKPKKTLKKRNPKKKDENSVPDAENTELKTIRIKPVILRDIQVLRTETKFKQRTKKEKVVNKFMCNYCGKMVSNKLHLLSHTGVKSYKCDICSKAYQTPGGLCAHKRNYHNQDKKFKCDRCIAAFTSASSLKAHYVMHLDENKFVCDVCSKSFKRRSALWRHKKMHNAANKSIYCDLCNMSFFTKYNLRHHLRIHTGERPFKCEICSQPYSYKHDFNRHCLKKHGVFLKRRSVYVMNEEVLQRERALMRDLMLKVQGISNKDEPLKAFEGTNGWLAYEMAIKALKSNNIPID